MRLLPHWAITSPSPAFYDTESGSSIEQTARVYAAMQELIKEYNIFVDDVNKNIVDFEKSINKNYEDFSNGINKLVHNYIAMLDEKIKQQDNYIDNTIVFIKNNLAIALSDMLKEMSENGELDNVILDAISSISENFEKRITTLENTTYVLEHDDVSETLTLKKIIPGGA